MVEDFVVEPVESIDEIMLVKLSREALIGDEEPKRLEHHLEG